MSKKTFHVFACLLIWLSVYKSNESSPCPSAKCAYRISRLNEIEYLMVKNILGNLIEKHRDVSAQYLNFFFNSQLRACDQYFEYHAIKQVIQKDYRHPHSLFDKLPPSQVNKTVRLQYEIEWLDKYKLIKHELQSVRNADQCNSFGLKLYYLIYEFAKNQRHIFKCSSGEEEPVSNLIDYYISQTFHKSCDGNLEMLSYAIYRLLNYDCSRAYAFKLAYFNSKYLNLFRTCDPDLNVNDLLNSGRFKNCSGSASSKNCAWYEITCKYPEICLKSMNWKTD